MAPKTEPTLPSEKPILFSSPMIRALLAPNGLPLCARERCAQFDGKRCRMTGDEPERVCEPAVLELAQRRDELLVTIRNLSASTPYPDEAGNAAVLIAEVGTLKATLRNEFETGAEYQRLWAEVTRERDNVIAEAERLRRNASSFNADWAGLRGENDSIRVALKEALNGWADAAAIVNAEPGTFVNRRLSHRRAAEAGGQVKRFTCCVCWQPIRWSDGCADQADEVCARANVRLPDTTDTGICSDCWSACGGARMIATREGAQR